MIFDPELAAAARRHARAQAKLNKASSAEEAQQTTTTTTTAATTTTSQPSPDKSNTSVSASASNGASPTGVLLEQDASTGVVRNDRANSAGSTVGGGGGPAGARAGEAVASSTASISRKSSAVNGDMDGVERVGPVAPRQRNSMKQRVLLKIIVLGCSNVGKTSLMKRYAANDFSERRRPTIGADFMTKEIIAADQPMLLQIWDTAGQERFHGGSLGSGFFRGANAALLVYDVACAESFEQVAMWREELLVRLDVDPHDFPIVVIGNKVDLAEGLPMDGVHGVEKSRVLKWCELQGMGHIETSAKDGTGVEVAMQAVAMLALDQYRKRERELELNPYLGGGRTLDIANARARQQNTRGCC